MRNAFVDEVIALAGGRSDLMMLSGDAGLGVFDRFREERPEAFLNLGVAEQNMASFGAGLALTGHKVYLYNIIPFLLYRCYEQVRNDLCSQNLPVVLVGIGSGVTYAPAGMSHYAVEDLGLAATLPNLTVLSPSDVHEARAAARMSLEAEGPLYVRLAKRGGPELHPGQVDDLAKPLVLRDGKDCALLFHGSIGEEAVQAADLLKQRGIGVRLVSLPMIQPLPEEALLEILEGIPLVMTAEEHHDPTGLGSRVERLKARSGAPWRLLTRGLPHRFLFDVNNTAGMRRNFGLSGAQLADDLSQALGGG